MNRLKYCSIRAPRYDVRPDQQPDDEEGARRQEHQAVGLVPAAIGRQRQNLGAEQAAGAEQFAQRRDCEQYNAVAQSVTDTVEKAEPRAIAHRKRLGTAENDAVGDNQADEDRELLRRFERICFQ
jgi:hypothetical protein